MLQQSAGQQSGRWVRRAPSYFLKIDSVEETKALSDVASPRREQVESGQRKSQCLFSGYSSCSTAPSPAFGGEGSHPYCRVT